MSKRESIARYTLIIKKLRKQPASFKEIANYLALESELQDYNFNISKRTFQLDIKDILSLYNIEIEYYFLMELLAHDGTVKIIAPKSLEEELKSIYLHALKRYDAGMVSESRFKVGYLN